jgi:hypothetical protein
MKKIYIPELKVRGNFLEELGTSSENTLYPGDFFEVSLAKDDFENEEDYHTVWINLTKAAQKKLQNGTSN